MTLLVLEDYVQIRDTIVEAVEAREIFEHIYTAGTVEEAINISEDNDISVFLVDLTLPDGSGYDFIRSIRTQEVYRNSWVVIATGAEETTDEVIDAYNSNHCQRYIKKPFSMAYLCEVLEELAGKKVVEVGIEDRIRIKRKSIDYFFEHDDIVYLETVDKTAYLYTKDKKYSIGRITLSELEDKLPNERFIRVHRSYIVNKDYIDFISRSNSQNQIKVKYYDLMIPIGRTYKDNYNLI